MKIAAVPFLLTASLAFAQPATTEFPPDAAAVTPSVLTEALADKVFSVKTATDPDWRWQFTANGYFFIDVGNRKVTGKWHAQDSALCTESRSLPAGCNEVRALGSVLYLKRNNGEVVKLALQ